MRFTDLQKSKSTLDIEKTHDTKILFTYLK